MKNTNKVITTIIGSLAALTVTGCVAQWTAPSLVVSGPPVVEVGPVVSVAPVVAVGPVVAVDFVPESYVWDGYEYVGFVGGGYVYLGPGGYWHHCDPWRIERFHGWEHGHPDWRSHPEHFGGGHGGIHGPVGHGPVGHGPSGHTGGGSGGHPTGHGGEHH